MTPALDEREPERAAYALLATLLRQGVTLPLLPLLQTLPGIVEALPDPYDPDEAAAAHYRLWQYTLHPYASLFLTMDGLLGGAATEEAIALYRALGIAPPASDSADHLATALEVLSLTPASPVRLLDWLLRWVPPLACAAVRQREPLAGAVVGLALDLVVEQAATLGGQSSVWQLPPVADPLGSERSGLREIAAYLATPPASGFFLSRDEVSAIGRRLRAPSGFGSRRDMLEALLRSAAEFDRWGELIAELRATVAHDQARLAMYPAWLSPSFMPWRQRLAATDGMLAQLAQATEPPD